MCMVFLEQTLFPPKLAWKKKKEFYCKYQAQKNSCVKKAAASIKPHASGRNIVGEQVPTLSGYMLCPPPLVASCCLLLGAFVQSLKPVKLLVTCKRTQYCVNILRQYCVRLHRALVHKKQFIRSVGGLNPHSYAFYQTKPEEHKKSNTSKITIELNSRHYHSYQTLFFGK